MNNEKDEELATMEEILQKQEELLLRQAIRSSSQLKNLAQIYTTALVKATQEVQLARKIAYQIRQIIRDDADQPRFPAEFPTPIRRPIRTHNLPTKWVGSAGRIWGAILQR